MCQLRLLLWKNFLIKFRRPTQLLIELGIPCSFFLLLMIIRYNVASKDNGRPVVWPHFEIGTDSTKEFENFNTTVNVFFTPVTHDTIALMEEQFAELQASMNWLSNCTVRAFENETAMEEFYLTTDSAEISLAIVFNHVTSEKLDIGIRIPHSPRLMAMQKLEDLDVLQWDTERVFPVYRYPGPRAINDKYGGPPSYAKQGFLTLQYLLVECYISRFYPDALDEFKTNYKFFLERMPYPPFKNDMFLYSIQFFIPMVFVISFIYPISNLTKVIVLEKEQRFTSMAAMMGVPQHIQWIAHFITALTFNVISITLIVICLKIPLRDGLCVLQNSSSSFLFFWFLVYVCNGIAFSFFIATLFNDSNMAGVVSGAVFFISFLPYYHISFAYGSMTWFSKMCFAFIMNINMSFSCMVLSMWESEGLGLRWSNFYDTPTFEDGITMNQLFVIQVLMIMIHILAALYISNVFPGQFGIPKEWNFFLTSQYWDTISNDRSTTSKKRAVRSDSDHSDPKTKEPTSATINACISGILQSSSQSMSLRAAMKSHSKIIKLYKTYDKGKTFSVKNLSLTLRKGEITMLLGHNGAGKSTLINMLCGMIVPTSGDIVIFGHPIYEIDAVRKDLGICLQSDVLFDDLTVKEHLYFYCKLKQLPEHKIEGEIKSIISMLNLEDKTNSISSTLSGGMKRKLSVGIAFIGGSKFVILDEATSGMDVSARRFIWDLLLKEKKERIILMSTHFMEEADVLGDKIAIMEAGQLKCFGTPMELKKKYGQGYLLAIALRDNTPQGVIDKIVNLLLNTIKGSKIVTSISSELTFSLPGSESQNFKKLFANLEKNSNELSIVNFGISISTIEEVFLNVGEFAKEGVKQSNKLAQNLQNVRSEKSLISSLKSSALSFNSGFSHNVQVFRAMMAKKQFFICNSYFFMFSLCFLPPFIMAISIILNQDGQQDCESPKLVFDMKRFKYSTFCSFTDNSTKAELLNNILLDYLNETNIEGMKYHYSNDSSLEGVRNYFVKKGQENIIEYTNNFLVATKFQSFPNNITALTGIFSNQAIHTAPTIMTIIQQTAMRRLLLNDHFELKFSIHPLPKKITETLHLLTFHTTEEVQLCFALTFSVSFLMASFVIAIVSEISSNFRHIQQISGLSLKCFWLTHFMLDYVYWIIGALFLVLVIFAANITPYNNAKECAFILVSIALLGLPALPFIYMLSFTVRDPSTGYVRISMYTSVIGTISFLFVVILRIPMLNLQVYSSFLEGVLQFILPIFTMPSQTFAIGKSRRAASLCNRRILFQNRNISLLDICHDTEMLHTVPGAKVCCEAQCGPLCFLQKSFLSWSKPGSLQFIVGYLVQTIFFWIAVYLIEIRACRCLTRFYSRLPSFKKLFAPAKKVILRQNSLLDDDVKIEQERINNTSIEKLHQTDAMWVKGLTKRFGKFIAVDNIYFGVKKAECFGILGTNGAGKTTTFKMITGAETISSGDIYINKMSVLKKMTDIYKHIGYCPQFNGLLEELTGRQTLLIISRIRGIQEKLIQKQIDVLAKLFFFERHIDKKIYTYSGGTKRKLSMACSIVGNPMVVFLDEPSTGVDPVSRRCLWNAVQALRAAGSSVVLTSHSMEECEALCNRLIIMVNAKLRCLGSPLHLKDKFGSGYIVQIKCVRHTKREVITDLIGNVKEHFGGNAKLESNHNKQLTFMLKTNLFQLSEIFGYIEELKLRQKFQIEDYSVGQTSLERIFLSFAREQVEIKKLKK